MLACVLYNRMNYITVTAFYVVLSKNNAFVKFSNINRIDRQNSSLNHDKKYGDVIKWKRFPRCWPFVWGIHRSPVNFPAQRPVTRSFDVFFDLSLNQRLSKQSWGWWFETLPRPLWRHCNVDSRTTRMFTTFLFNGGSMQSLIKKTTLASVKRSNKAINHFSTGHSIKVYSSHESLAVNFVVR